MIRQLIILAIQLTTCELIAQTVSVSKNQRIVLGSDKNYSFECHLTTHPQNTNFLAGAILTIDEGVNPSTYYTTLIVSRDGGKNWSIHKNDFPYAADPFCLITTKGNIVASDIAGAEYALGAHYLKNGKLQKAIKPLPSYDHDILVLKPYQPGSKEKIYLVATKSLDSIITDHPILVMQSTDEGKTYQSKTIYPFKNVNLNAKQPVILSDGTLLIPLVVRGFFSNENNKTQHLAEQSSWIISSKDGVNFSEPKFITPVSGRAHNMLVVNTAAQWKDHLYYICPDAQKKALYISRSFDKGEGWSIARKITHDTAGIIGVGAAAIDRKGTIGIVYNQMTGTESKPCYDWFFIYSKDDGANFSIPVKINEGSNCPDVTQGWYTRAWPQGGDYGGLVATKEGTFMALWSDARLGKYYPYSAEITIK
jgi:hypothetical protein